MVVHNIRYIYIHICVHIPHVYAFTCVYTLKYEGTTYSPQISCLENPMDRGAWQVIVRNSSLFLSSRNLLPSEEMEWPS